MQKNKIYLLTRRELLSYAIVCGAVFCLNANNTIIRVGQQKKRQFIWYSSAQSHCLFLITSRGALRQPFDMNHPLGVAHSTERLNCCFLIQIWAQ